MGLLDQLSGMLGGGQSGNQQLLQMALSLMQGNGGLQGMLKQFQQSGLGDLASSWVGNGPNQSLGLDQLRDVVGGEQLGRLAQANGLSEDQAASGLSELLPQLIDKITPDGQVDTGDNALKQGLDILGKLF